MAKIFDNIEVKFTDALQSIITNQGVKRVDFCVGYFNLRGWNLVVEQIDNLPGDFVYEECENNNIFRCCRLLIGMHQPDQELVRKLYSAQQLTDANYVSQCKLEIAKEFRKQLLIGLPTAKDEWTLRRLSAQLKDKKVCVKLYLAEPLHAKLYLAHRPDDNWNKIQAIMGSSNLTYAGLTKQGELNAEFADSDQAEKLADWFDDRWNNQFCIDITKELIDAIDNSWAGETRIPPYYIYLKTAYNLSSDARSGDIEYVLPTEFKNELFEFQQTAVKIAAKNLNKRGGAMIGDVVGLGKTITACAIAKIYEMNYASSTLIICPANLKEMWNKYIKNYDLKAQVMSNAERIDVDSTRYYRLIIVDESHNLRNEDGKRYQNIKALIEHQDCNVLLLTATPYNKHFSDLSSQLKLFIGGDDDLGIRPEAYIRELEGDHAFLQKHSEIFIRSIRAFEKSTHVDDWQDLMKLFLVRRTRTFIKQYYAKTDEKNKRKYLEFKDGRKSYFPDREAKTVKFKITEGDQYSRLYSDEMVDLMKELKLPRYGLSLYVNPEKVEHAPANAKALLDNLSRAGQRMMGFCQSTFFKRMDSSGFSFLLTLYRHILRNAVFIYAIKEGLPLPISDENQLPEEYLDDEDINDIFSHDNEEEDRMGGDNLIEIPTYMNIYMGKAKDYYNHLAGKNNVKWLDSQYFKRTLAINLKKDCEELIKMIMLCDKWNPKTDQKLNKMEELLKQTHNAEKVLIFTQYSDTANYIYCQLCKRGIVHIERATGGSKNPTQIAERFSPMSNKADIPASQELRVLVATDVLSEGQNLQDAHVIVNYDMPWAIIRLIQRAGRVDRIGQEAEKIFCYSFFPAEGVEKIIKLRKRLNDRINENAGVIGSDEVFFEGNAQNLRDMFNEKSDILDDDDDNDVDLSSQAFQIWKNATDANPQLKQIIPQLSDAIYSTKAATSAVEDGVITYAKTYNDYDVLSWYGSDGNIISQSQKRILQALECSADEPALEPLSNHFELIETAVSNIKTNVSTASGILGNRFSTRYRIVDLLQHYYEQPPTLFFNEDSKQLLKLAIDDIFNYQLLESSRVILGRMLKRGGNNHDDIVETVLEMHRNGTLCKIVKDDGNKESRIICSMGLRNNH